MPSQQRFFFIRHGETDWNIALRLQGKTDIPLNENGRRQAALAAQKLYNCGITRIISSDLCRAGETAQIIQHQLQNELFYHAGLQERHFGLIEGMSADEIKARPQHELFHDIMEENGFMLALQAETLPEFDMRIRTTLENLLQEHVSETVLLVAHGGVFSSLTRQLLQQNIRSHNAAPYCFSCTDNRWTLQEILPSEQHR